VPRVVFREATFEVRRSLPDSERSAARAQGELDHNRLDSAAVSGIGNYLPPLHRGVTRWFTRWPRWRALSSA